MAQPKTWLHFLTDQLGRCYKYVNGQAIVSAAPVFLPTGPDGWMDKTIKWARDSNYHELFRTFTNPFKYVKEAAFIVRDRKYRKGSEDKLFHVIHKLDKSFGGGWQHNYFYKGQVDLARVEDTDTSVSVNIMEGGLSKFLKAYENIDYELDINVPEAVIIKNDGITLKQKANYLLNNGTLPDDLGGATISLQLIGNESVSSIAATSEQRVKTSNAAGPLWNANTQFLTTGSEDTTVTLEWDFNLTMELATGISPINPTSVFLQLHVLESDSVRTFTNIQTLPFTDPIQIYNHKHNWKGTYTATIPANRKCVLYMSTSNNTRDFTFWTFDNDGSFSIDYTYRHRTTFIKALRPLYVAQKLLDKMTGGGYQLTSNYISAEWNNLLLTSGDAIRGITGAKLKTSWRAFFDGYNVPCNLSSGIRDQVMYVEKKGNAYQQNIQLDLGSVDNLVVNDATNYQYNRISIGYPNTDTEIVNGKDEFNVTFNYTSVVASNSKVLQLISSYRASMYEIEELRINLDGKTTTDATNDNTCFFLHVEVNSTAGGVDEPAVYYKLLRNVYTSVTGLVSPSSAYNLELHPELCLKRHGNYIRGVFYWLDGTNLVRDTTDKNDKVVVMQGANIYIGNKNILVGSLAAPLFIPLTLTVEGPMPDSAITILETGPNGTFSFNYSGIQYLGFPLETSIQPVDRPAQETVLLCSPLTDINNLITIGR